MVYIVSRSEVFAAMLRHEFLEKQNSRVDVKEIDGETMELLLSYIYTGQVCPSCFENCCQIEILGDRFQECLCGGALQGSRQVVAKLHFVTRSFIGFPLVPEKTLAKYNHENILLLIG